MSTKSMEERMGGILQQLERGQEDRREMRDDLKDIRRSFASMETTFEAIRKTMEVIDKRSAKVETIIIGDGEDEKGLLNRVYFLEAQVKSHDAFIAAVRSAAWKVIVGVLSAAAVSGGIVSRIVEAFAHP